MRCLLLDYLQKRRVTPDFVRFRGRLAGGLEPQDGRSFLSSPPRRSRDSHTAPAAGGRPAHRTNHACDRERHGQSEVDALLDVLMRLVTAPLPRPDYPGIHAESRDTRGFISSSRLFLWLRWEGGDCHSHHPARLELTSRVAVHGLEPARGKQGYGAESSSADSVIGCKLRCRLLSRVSIYGSSTGICR